MANAALKRCATQILSGGAEAAPLRDLHLRSKAISSTSLGLYHLLPRPPRAYAATFLRRFAAGY